MVTVHHHHALLGILLSLLVDQILQDTESR
jgi:hypothetical protein